MELLVTFDQLGSKDVSFVDDHLVVFSLLLLLSLGFADDILESGDVLLLCLDHFFRAGDVLHNLEDVVFELFVLLLVLLLLFIFGGDALLLVKDFFFKMRDLLSHSSELHFELSDLFLSFKQVLGV